MSKSTNVQFNIEPLVIEIEKVIKNGLPRPPDSGAVGLELISGHVKIKKKF